MKLITLVLLGVSAMLAAIVFLLVCLPSQRQARETTSVASPEDSSLVVSLTTIPSRIKNLPRILRYIRSELPSAPIVVNIPHTLKRLKQTYDESKVCGLQGVVPHLIINRVEDIGPITKLLPTLQHPVGKAAQAILVVDDDEVFQRGWFRKLVRLWKRSKDPSTTVAMPFERTKYWKQLSKNVGRQVKTIAGFVGYIVPTALLTQTAQAQMQTGSTIEDCRFSDDFVISSVLANDLRFSLIVGKQQLSAKTDVDNHIDALHHLQDHKQKYVQCDKKLRKLIVKRRT